MSNSFDLFVETKKNHSVYIESDWLESWIYDGIIYLKYKPDVIIDIKAARQVLKDRLTLCDGKSYPAITHGKDVKYWTKEAREFQNTPENYEHYTAAAVLYTDNLIPTTIINFYLAFTTPLIPARFFTKDKDAYNWILKFKNPIQAAKAGF